MSFLGVKYLLIENEEAVCQSMLKHLDNTETIHIYENEAVYPFAFINYSIMPKGEFDKLSKEDKTVALLYSTIVDESMLEKSYVISKEKQDIITSARKKQNDFKLISFENDILKFRIHVDENNQFLSFSVPYDVDWHIYVDGIEVPTYKINISLLGAKISEGEHIVVLKYKPKMLYIGIVVSIGTGVLIITYLKMCQKRAKREIKRR